MSCEGGCHAPGCRLDQVTAVLVGGYDQCETSASSFDDHTPATKGPLSAKASGIEPTHCRVREANLGVQGP
jgi:hypothetical protein